MAAQTQSGAQSGAQTGAQTDSERPFEVPAELPSDGIQARARVSRKSLGQWEPSPDRRDPVAILHAQDGSRIPELLPLRYQRMSESPFAFFRGAAAIMAADLGSRPHTGLIVQMCGDAHLANFGGFATPDRKLVFDLNDFDETLPGPFEWDVARLVSSFHIAGEHRNLSAKDTRGLVAMAARTYVREMANLANQTRLTVWYTRLDAADITARWGDQAAAKGWDWFDRLMGKGAQKTSERAVSRYTHIDSQNRLRLISKPPLVVPVSELPAQAATDIPALLAGILREYRASLQDDRDKLISGYQLVDGARKVVGVGSVGTRCLIGLLTALDDPEDDLVLQCKQAEPSVYESVLPKSRYHNCGQRVVEGQRLTQAASDVLLGWTQIPDAHGVPMDFYVRQMWDWKTSADLEQMGDLALRLYARLCGWTLARAHARSGSRKALAAYLGSGDSFTEAMVEFAGRYAAQNQRDYHELLAAIRAGRVAVSKSPAEQSVDM